MGPRTLRPWMWILCLLSLILFHGDLPEIEPVRVHEMFSQPYHVDRLVPSMTGPYHVQPVRLNVSPQLAWLVGYEMVATDLDGRPFPKQDLVCHGHVRYPGPGAWARGNQQRFGGRRQVYYKWVTVVPGATWVKFPPGFGIPFYTDEPLENLTMALNLDADRPPTDLRIRTRMHYVLDSERRRTYQALGSTGITLLQAEGPRQSIDAAKEGIPAVNLCGDDFAFDDRSVTQRAFPDSHARGGRFMHFLVPPGRHVYQSDLAKPFRDDTTLHHITAHLHVHGQKVELWDRTAGKLIFTSYAKPNAKQTYVNEMSSYNSLKGIPVKGGHLFQVVAYYDNPTSRPIDAMAVFYLRFKETRDPLSFVPAPLAH